MSMYAENYPTKSDPTKSDIGSNKNKSISDIVEAGTRNILGDDIETCNEIEDMKQLCQLYQNKKFSSVKEESEAYNKELRKLIDRLLVLGETNFLPLKKVEKFRRKVGTVAAIKWVPFAVNLDYLQTWLWDSCSSILLQYPYIHEVQSRDCIKIYSYYGNILVWPGEWIVLEDDGKLYCYDDEAFTRVFVPTKD